MAMGVFAGQAETNGYADIPEGGRFGEEESRDEDEGVRARGDGEWYGKRREQQQQQSGVQDQTGVGCRPVWGLDHAINEGGSSSLLA